MNREGSIVFAPFLGIFGSLIRNRLSAADGSISSLHFHLFFLGRINRFIAVSLDRMEMCSTFQAHDVLL